MDSDTYQAWLGEVMLRSANEILDDDTHLVWVDIETTGLDPAENVMLEIGLIITDKYGHLLDPPFGLYIDSGPVVHCQELCVPFVREMHEKSHLWSKDDPYWQFQQETMDAPHAEVAIVDWLSQYVGHKLAYMAGSTVGFDRFAFLQRYMPDVHEYCHYRSVDNSTTKILVQEFQPWDLARMPVPQKLHRSLPDLVDSIHEYQFYIDRLFNIPSGERGLLCG